jgi:hypothetical protein
MAEPPFALGAVQETGVLALIHEVAVTAVGSPGVPTSSELVGAEGTLDPAPLAAVTVKVYVVPVTRPLNVQLVAAVEQVKLLGDEVTV